MSRITVLPSAVQSQIAAGEVIERPASVVKELVENALDAGARRIEVQLRGGGLERIVVRDDGAGIDADDVGTAFERHATSKLVRIEDLEDVTTLGFRGEALPSIASVAQVTVVTRTATATSATAVAADADGVRPLGPRAAPIGTTFTVESLFANVPARRKFLKTAATEVGHVTEWLQRLAVAHPGTGFKLEHDGRVLLDHPAVKDLDQRLAQVLGRSRGAELAVIDEQHGAFRVHGRLGVPRETLSTPRWLWTYVSLGDGAPRWVRDKLLLRAVLDGYESLIMRGRYPVVVLFIHVPPGEIDVNVHPAKLEVRFRRSAALHQLIAPAIRARLRHALKTKTIVIESESEPDAAGEPFELTPAMAVTVPGWEAHDAATVVAEMPPPAPLPVADEVVAAPAMPSGVPRLPIVPSPRALPQASLWQPAPQGYASLRFIGQLFDGYLLCEGAGRVVLIDQHAAHERVAFEKLRTEQQRGGVARDTLLVPQTVTLAPAEIATLADHAAIVADAGFEGEPFGDGTYLLRTTPRLLHGQDAADLLRAVAAELNEDGATSAAQAAIDHVLATVACHSVVRVGQRLHEPDVRALLVAMDGVDVNAHCPHGRPVTVELSRTQVESLFRR